MVWYSSAVFERFSDPDLRLTDLTPLFNCAFSFRREAALMRAVDARCDFLAALLVPTAIFRPIPFGVLLRNVYMVVTERLPLFIDNR